MPLRKEDRQLTTFITPYGRYRYRRNPQGFVGAEDGYNRRFDEVLADFLRKERCVHDAVFFDNGLKEHWWRTIKYLTTVGRAGIVLNPDKFQFSKQEVEFAGFKIGKTTVRPLTNT